MRKKRPSSRPSSTHGGRRPRQWTRRHGLALALIAVALASGALYWRVHPRGSTRTAAVSPGLAWARARALVAEGASPQALPLFREAIKADGGPAAVHMEFSAALQHAAVKTTLRAGRYTAATTSSDRRVALLRESLSELDAAERIATSPSERALIMAHRANRLLIWGFPWDALIEFRRAEQLDPQWIPLANELTGWLHHPERARLPDSLE